MNQDQAAKQSNISQTLQSIETTLNDMNQTNKLKKGFVNRKLLYNIYKLRQHVTKDEFILPNKTNKLMSTHSKIRFNN